MKQWMNECKWKLDETDCFVNVSHWDTHFLNGLPHLIIETLRSQVIPLLLSHLTSRWHIWGLERLGRKRCLSQRGLPGWTQGCNSSAFTLSLFPDHFPKWPVPGTQCRKAWEQNAFRKQKQGCSWRESGGGEDGIQRQGWRLERLAGVRFSWAVTWDVRKFRDFLCVLNRSKSGPWVRREFSCFEMENSGVIFTAAIS